MVYILFFLLSIVCVGAIIAMIATKNQVYNAFLLVLAFACMGGLFALLQAPFIAAVQIIIYAGAILVLFIFVIMMINLRQELPPEKKKTTVYLAIGAGVVLLGEFFFSLKSTILPSSFSSEGNFGSPKQIGHVLFSEYLYPFEITSVLILAALVGAIVLVKKRERK